MKKDTKLALYDKLWSMDVAMTLEVKLTDEDVGSKGRISIRNVRMQEETTID